MHNSKSNLVETEYFNSERPVSHHLEMMAFCLNLFAGIFTRDIEKEVEPAPFGMDRLQVFRDGGLIMGDNLIAPSMALVNELPEISADGIFRRRLATFGAGGHNADSWVIARLGRDYRGREISTAFSPDDKTSYGLPYDNQDYLILGEMKRLFNAIATSRTIRRALDDNKRVHILVGENTEVIWSYIPETLVERGAANIMIGHALRSLTQTLESAPSDDDGSRPDNMKIAHLNLLGHPYRLISMAGGVTIAEVKSEKAFLDGLVHKLKGKLGAILTAVDCLGRNGGGISEDENAQLVGIIEKAAGQMETIISRFEECVNLPEPRVQNMELVAWLKSMVATGNLSEYPIHVIAKQDSLAVTTDEQLLRLALSELIDNAHEAETNHDPIKVALDCEADSIIISISGAAPLVSDRPILPDNIVVPFSSTKPDRAGLGLTIAQKAINRLGGRMDFGFSDEVGFTARLIFPSNFYGDK